MDFKQLKQLLLKAGITEVSTTTRENTFVLATKNNYKTEQYYNRGSATWKTAQHIIVDDWPPSEIDILLKKWRELTKGYNDQYLYVYNPNEDKYGIYNSKCELLGDETYITTKLSPSEISGNNLIFFGAPGTGKSFKLNEKKHTINNLDCVERVTFHPDYSYANFVGTYKPVPEGENISYKYVPGPFMRVLVNALNDTSHQHLLLIEEINRANVAAVFGDVFQLLDRDLNGESMYPIAPSEDMKKYLKDNVNGDGSFDEITIPDNMFIWATMNSADQGVFPMDTAFKRRWDFEYIGINNGEDKISNHEFELGEKEQKRKLTWNVLRKSINDILSEQRINEDKLLGPFFISEMALDKDGNERPITNERFIEIFKNKVIMYLFEDAAKQRRGEVFNSEKTNVNRYSDICEAFDKHGVLIFKGIESYLEKNSQSQTQNFEVTNT